MEALRRLPLQVRNLLPKRLKAPNLLLRLHSSLVRLRQTPPAHSRRHSLGRPRRPILLQRLLFLGQRRPLMPARTTSQLLNPSLSSLEQRPLRPPSPPSLKNLRNPPRPSSSEQRPPRPLSPPRWQSLSRSLPRPSSSALEPRVRQRLLLQWRPLHHSNLGPELMPTRSRPRLLGRELLHSGERRRPARRLRLRRLAPLLAERQCPARRLRLRRLAPLLAER